MLSTTLTIAQTSEGTVPNIYWYAEQISNDPETGCIESDEECKQTFYLKQQNEIPANDVQDDFIANNTELSDQILQLQEEVQGLQLTQETKEIPWYNTYSSPFIFVIIVTLFFTFIVGMLAGIYITRQK